MVLLSRKCMRNVMGERLKNMSLGKGRSVAGEHYMRKKTDGTVSLRIGRGRFNNGEQIFLIW